MSIRRVPGTETTGEKPSSSRGRNTNEVSDLATVDMEVRTYLLATVGFLGFLSGLLGFLAESKKIVEGDVTRVSANECMHSRSPSLVLGIVAAIALLIAQIISNALGGCLCCESGPDGPLQKNGRAIVAITLLVLSWITFSIAFLLLLAGASVNDRRDASDNMSTGCYILKSGVFTGAAFAAFSTTILGIVYNFQATTIRNTASAMLLGHLGTNSSEENSNNSLIALASPQYTTGKPMFPTRQRLEKAPGLVTEIQNPKSVVYSRSATNNDKVLKSQQMVCLRENYQNYSDHIEDAAQTNQSSQNQSASAAFMPVAKANMDLNIMWNNRSVHSEEPQPSQTSFTRQGIGKVWDQSKYYQEAPKYA